MTSKSTETEPSIEFCHGSGRAEFWRSTQPTRTVAELESTIQKVLGKTGLMSFVQFDHGAILRKGTNRETPRMVRVVMGNPLIMKEMAKHVPDAGSYAPVTVLVDGAQMACICPMTGCQVNSSLWDPDALRVAKDLDKKVEDLFKQAAG